MPDFTICMPMRDSDEEYAHLAESLPSAIKLCPSEVVIGVDAPASDRIKSRVLQISRDNDYPVSNIKLVEVKKTSDWNLQLAKVDYEIIKASSYDRIFYFNVDVVLNSNILLSANEIGNDGIACISFTKRLLQKTLSDKIRFYYYQKDLAKEPMPFAGIYWIYKPYYLELIDPEKYKKIYNGIDNFLTEAILKSQKYKLVCRKEFGCDCLTYESADYPWRQFQVGMWLGANKEKVYANYITFWRKILQLAFKRQHHYLIKGCMFARRHPEHESVKLARTMSFIEWCLLGSKYLPQGGFKLKGTGVVERQNL